MNEASKRSIKRTGAGYFSVPLPCEDALRQLADDYNRLADQIEEAWANEQRLDAALTRAMDRGNAYERALEMISGMELSSPKAARVANTALASSLDSEQNTVGGGQAGCG